ncbi:MAG TPA: Do family serine endopeptidase [Patescibacteria group bacterium]|nr:Do family serine endopeptidase [Patescibacteria group bacterium]
MSTEKSRKSPLLLAIALIGVGIVFGIILVSSFSSNSLRNAFAGSIDDIGAKSAPVTVGSEARILDEAFVSASKAVTPTVVSISVIGEARTQPNPFGDMFPFFGSPDDEEMRPQPRGGQKSQGSGSGVIITQDGYIVTNNHVIEDAEEGGITVTTTDRREYKAELVGRDPLTDLAVIKIEGSGFPVAHFENKDNIRVGEWVIAVGNPLGLRSTVTSGIVSAIGRGNLNMSRDQYAVENFIQTDAAINPGNSGGGLFNLQGSLVGINTAIATRTGYYQGYGFAIPIDIVRAVALDIMEDGKVDRGYIGVSIQTIDEVAAKSVNLDRIAGVLVGGVIEGSPADKAGVEIGDVILELNGTPVNTSNELQGYIALRKAGDNVKLKIWRNGKMIEKNVRLEARAVDTQTTASIRGRNNKDQNNTGNAPVSFEKLGFTVGTVTENVRRDYSISGGALVTKRDPYGEAAKRGLAPMDVIVKAGDRDINSPEDLKNYLSGLSAGDAVLLQVRTKEGRRLVSIQIPKGGL